MTLAEGAALTRRVFLVNADVYRGLLEEHPAPRGQSDQYLLSLMQELGVFTPTTARLETLAGANIEAIAERRGVHSDVVRTVMDRWVTLTSFPIPVPALETIEVAGTLTVGDRTPIPAADFSLYRVTADVPVTTFDGDRTAVSFTPAPADRGDPVAMPDPFSLRPNRPVVTSSATGPVTVRVRGLDGSNLYSRGYDSTDPALAELDITVGSHLPGELEPGGAVTPAAGLDRRTRGQVLRRTGTGNVSGLTGAHPGQSRRKPSVVADRVGGRGERFRVPLPPLPVPRTTGKFTHPAYRATTQSEDTADSVRRAVNPEMKPAATPTVWVDDPHPIFRRGLVTCLSGEGFRVAGESAALSPEPPGSGIDVLIFQAEEGGLPRAVAFAKGSGVRLVAMVRHAAETLLADVVESGVAGIVLFTDVTPRSLLASVRSALLGHTALPQEVLTRLLDRAANGARHAAGSLTPRELEVLRLLAEGDDTREIAEELCFSERTVKNVVHDVLMKMNCRNRAHAVALATRQGVI